MTEIALKEVRKLISKKSLLKYLRSLPPETTFNMEDCCACAYHGLLCEALALDDGLVGAFVDTLRIDDQEIDIGERSFAARFQIEAMNQQRARRTFDFGSALRARRTTAEQLIEIAEGMKG